MLIDGDNAQPSLIADVLAETAKYGVVTTRRIYGDWTTPQMSGWKDALHSYAVQPMQQFRYTTGKNSTDSALIIDAMDLLHAGTVAGFCIVSSDSDYTRLATRIREQGLFVMGVGRSQTPESFVKACEIFVYTEILGPESKNERPTETASRSDDWTKMVAQAIDMGLQDDGWAFLGAVGNHLRQLDSAFDPRTYGQNQLSLLIKSRPDLFEMPEPKTKSGPALLYVRLKAESSKAS
ncbi:MAG: NYN domain-containing protein [Chloroflexota bacterium]|nr:NYN domain-containing protein [Chloroflexota bacterium]